jgi:hypothetical protein
LCKPLWFNIGSGRGGATRFGEEDKGKEKRWRKKRMAGLQLYVGSFPNGEKKE